EEDTVQQQDGSFEYDEDDDSSEDEDDDAEFEGSDEEGGDEYEEASEEASGTSSVVARKELHQHKRTAILQVMKSRQMNVTNSEILKILNSTYGDDFVKIGFVGKWAR